MILSVHIIFGTTAASLVPSHPIGAFSIAFLSHFILDSIPHKDYNLKYFESNENEQKKIINTVYNKISLFRDMFLVFIDGLVGICIAFMLVFDPAKPWIFLIGIVGSLLPDFLTFLYLLIKHKSLSLFFKFHVSFIHSKFILKLNQLTGVITQFITLAILVALLFGVKNFL